MPANWTCLISVMHCRFGGKLPRYKINGVQLLAFSFQLSAFSFYVIGLFFLVKNFITALTSQPQVYLHEDPANAIVVQIYKPDCWTGWHFDRAIFTTIINLGEPEAGGVFQWLITGAECARWIDRILGWFNQIVHGGKVSPAIGKDCVKFLSLTKHRTENHKILNVHEDSSAALTFIRELIQL